MAEKFAVAVYKDATSSYAAHINVEADNALDAVAKAEGMDTSDLDKLVAEQNAHDPNTVNGYVEINNQTIYDFTVG